MTALIALPENPGPEPHQLGMLNTADGFKIRYAVYRPPSLAKNGTIVLLHGRNEAVEKYNETIGDLLDRSFDVVTFDWRGQGGSSRFFSDQRRGHIDTFDQYATDLDQVFTEIVLPESRPPHYVLAHSTGCLVAIYAAHNLANRIRRMLLSSPFLGINEDVLSERQVAALSGTFRMLGLGSMHMGGSREGIANIPFEKNLVTSDPVRYARNKELMDPKHGLGLGSATAGWLDASIKALQLIRNPEHIAKIHIPILMVGAGADRIVAQSAMEDYANRMRSGSLVIIDGARHELMQEADQYRDQFLSALDAFIPGSEM